MRRVPSFLLAVPAAALIVAGCASTQPTAQPVAPAAAVAAPAPAQAEAPKPKVSAEFYEVFHDNGRVYRFDDFKTYHEFLATGEVAYVLTQIGAGPKGETVVWGQTKANAGKSSGFPGYELVAGNLKPDELYAEVINKGRIYVADDLKELMTFRNSHEATYSFVDVGSGPKGETVVYVLTKAASGKRPDALIAMFKAKRGL
ncbi:MAG: hypothetical protein ACLGHG_00910 [Gammaproteobacteria bacterium]